MHQDFPMMIYHIQLGQKTVKDSQELIFYENQGWIKDYQTFQKRNTIDEKINYHTAELKKLKETKKIYVVTNGKNVTMTKLNNIR